jgi:hypothetical protein
MGVLVIYTALMSPIDIAFEFTGGGTFETVYNILDVMLLCLFACDIIINFRVTYFDDDQSEVVNSREIMKNYLQNYNFYLDMVSTVPISELSNLVTGSGSSGVNNTYTRIIKQFKLFRILRLAKLNKFL